MSELALRCESNSHPNGSDYYCPVSTTTPYLYCIYGCWRKYSILHISPYNRSSTDYRPVTDLRRPKIDQRPHA